MTPEVRVRPLGTDSTGLRPLDPPLSTAAWYGDPALRLAFPEDWTVVVHEPDLPPPLSRDEMVAHLRDPVGAAPLAVVAAGARRVAIIVDDLTRPTPAEVVLPLLLDELATAGIEREQVTIVIAAGTHGPPPLDAMRRKVGAAAEGCRLVAHDDLADCPKVGVSRMGTPVFVDPEILAADLVLGLGGVYPQHSTGFGGGSKLAIGVLGRATITRLHFGHESMEGRYDVANDFRADLAEIAAMIGLRWTVMVHVNARREIVQLVSGDPEQAYPAAAAFSRERFAAPLPADADVVIANAYPMDISATFMRSKGVIPLLHARPGASRLLLAACPEGLGHHGLFPLQAPTGIARLRRRIEMTRARGWPEVVRLARAVMRRPFRARSRAAATTTPPPRRLPILMYQTIDPPTPLPAQLPGMQVVETWSAVLDTIRAQQQGKGGLRVVVYACAPLQVFEG
jgi:nickel-dependent lactate racemase